MSDYASIIGGNAPDSVVGTRVDDLRGVGQGWAAYYYIESANVFLDRFSTVGTSIVDGRNNTGGSRIELGSGSDTITTGAGSDAIWAGAGNDIILAGRGDDSVPGAPEGNNTVSGGDGNDLIVGGSRNDSLSGGAGVDTIRGGFGNDYAAGGDGADSILGGAGNDSLYGGSGNDSLYGQDGDDILVGGDGDDLLMGGAGNDTMFGSGGRDVFAFDNGFGQDVISDLRPGDQINLATNINGFNISSANDLVSLNMVSGGTTATGTKYTLITIGQDTIRLEKVDSADFINQIGSWVRVG